MSFQAKQEQVLGQQLKVQQLVLFANNPLITVSGSDLLVNIGESVSSVLGCQKQIAAGTLSGVVGSVHSTDTYIKIAGESAAAATTSYVINYIVAE